MTAGAALRRTLLGALYDEEHADDIAADLDALLDRHGRREPSGQEPWDENDAWLITYADQFQRSGEPQLRSTPLAVSSPAKTPECAEFILENLDDWAA